jgi:hypothetical protein
LQQWWREIEDNRRLAIRLEQERMHALQQRDDARQRIEQMLHSQVQTIRFLPSDQDLMALTLEGVRSLQLRLQEDLSKLTMVSEHTDVDHLQRRTIQIEQSKVEASTPAGPIGSAKSTMKQSKPQGSTASPRHRRQKHSSNKHVLLPSSAPAPSKH